MTQTDLPGYHALLVNADEDFAEWSPFVTPTGVEPPTPPTAPGDLLGLLVTEAEVAMWRDRAKNGPYRVTGDVSNNSPGHWAEMVNSSTLNFTSWRWSGPTNLTGGRVNKDASTSNDPPGTVKSGAISLLDAAVVAVVNDNTTLAQAVIDEIAWYPTQTNLNFGSRTLYPFDYYNDINPLFMMAQWVLYLVQAYDIAMVLGTGSATVEGWFDDLGELCDDSLRNSLGSVFPNRADDSYSSRSSFVDTGLNGSTRLANGSIVYHSTISKFYNNRRTEMAGYLGLSGLLTGRTTHVSWAKRYAREWMMFGNRTTVETFGDHNRGTSGYPQKGYEYDIKSLARILPFMEALARQGDTSLYDFTSSEGSAHPTWGSDHAKTMREVLTQRIGWVNGTITAQYTSDGDPPPSSIAGDAYYRIKSRRSGQNEIVQDGWLLAPASYYNEPGWVNVIGRIGTPSGFTSTPNNDGPVGGWRLDTRSRFMRSLDANPYGS